MIEMRWILKSVRVDDMISKKERVLQYRQIVDKTAYSRMERPDGVARWSWTDWRDVPEVRK